MPASSILKEPKGFKELCEKVGLALMMGQKLQYALAYYYAVYHQVDSKWSKDKAKKKIDYHLSKPMGNIVASIEKDTLIDAGLLNEIKNFKKSRNWLTHNFDEESTPFLVKKQKIDFYTNKMNMIIYTAYKIMIKLDKIGEELVSVKRNN